ncbi:MAG: hypothetical protein AB8E15_02170 [Bdellovibrionales bacterium]
MTLYLSIFLGLFSFGSIFAGNSEDYLRGKSETEFISEMRLADRLKNKFPEKSYNTENKIGRFAEILETALLHEAIGNGHLHERDERFLKQESKRFQAMCMFDDDRCFSYISTLIKYRFLRSEALAGLIDDAIVYVQEMRDSNELTRSTYIWWLKAARFQNLFRRSLSLESFQGETPDWESNVVAEKMKTEIQTATRLMQSYASLNLEALSAEDGLDYGLVRLLSSDLYDSLGAMVLYSGRLKLKALENWSPLFRTFDTNIVSMDERVNRGTVFYMRALSLFSDIELKLPYRKMWLSEMGRIYGAKSDNYKNAKVRMESVERQIRSWLPMNYQYEQLEKKELEIINGPLAESLNFHSLYKLLYTFTAGVIQGNIYSTHYKEYGDDASFYLRNMTFKWIEMSHLSLQCLAERDQLSFFIRDDVFNASICDSDHFFRFIEAEMSKRLQWSEFLHEYELAIEIVLIGASLTVAGVVTRLIIHKIKQKTIAVVTEKFISRANFLATNQKAIKAIERLVHINPTKHFYQIRPHLKTANLPIHLSFTSKTYLRKKIGRRLLITEAIVDIAVFTTALKTGYHLMGIERLWDSELSLSENTMNWIKPIIIGSLIRLALPSGELMVFYVNRGRNLKVAKIRDNVSKLIIAGAISGKGSSIIVGGKRMFIGTLRKTGKVVWRRLRQRLVARLGSSYEDEFFQTVFTAENLIGDETRSSIQKEYDNIRLRLRGASDF